MSDIYMPPFKVHKWIKVLLGLAAVMTILLALTLLMLPRMVSSNWFKLWMEESATAVLHRSIRIDTLQWNWSKGILLENLVLADSPDFSEKPMAAIDRLRFDLSYRALLQRQVSFEFELDGAIFNLIRKADGQTNLEALLAQLSDSPPAVAEPSSPPKPEDTAPPGQTQPLELPVDIQTRVKLKNITLQAVDHQQGRTMRASASRLNLDMPSLFRAPITLEMSTRLDLEENLIAVPFLDIRIANLFDADGALQLSRTAIDLKGELPGGRMAMNGTLAQLHTGLEIDLAQLFDVVAPLLPLPMSATEVAGRVDVTAELKGDPRQALQFDSTFALDGLKVAGGALGKKGAGPLKLKLINNGTLDLDKGTANIETGQVFLQDNSRLNWQLQSQGLKQADPHMSVDIGPMSLDLAELIALARDFLPPDVVLDLTSGEQAATFNLKEIHYVGKPLTGPHAFRMDDLALQLPAFTLKANDQLLSGGDVVLAVKSLQSDAPSMLPNAVNLNGSMHIGRIHLNRPQDVRVTALNVPDFTLRIEDIRPSDKALLGISARISLNQSLSCDELTYSHEARLANLSESLAAVVNLAPEPLADMEVKGFSLHTPMVEYRHEDWGVVKTNVRLESTLSDLHVDTLTPLKADMGRFTSHLQVGEVLDCHFEAQAKNLGLEGIKTNGRIQLDMGHLTDEVLAKLKPEWCRNLRLGGNVDAVCEINGRRPGPQELEALLDKTVQPHVLIENSAFIERLHLSAALDQLSVDMPLSGKDRLTANRISTGQPFAFTMTRGLKALDVGGALRVDNISVLPNLGRLEKNMAMDFSFSGRVLDLKTLRITQNMSLSPLNLTQGLRLRLAGLDRILIDGLAAPIPAVLSHGEGTLQGNLAIEKDADLSFTDNLFLDGNLKAGAQFLLVPGNRVSAEAWMNTAGMNARWGDLLNIDTLKSRLNLTKTFKLAQGRQGADDGSTDLPLSQAVLNPSRASKVAAEYPLLTQRPGDVYRRYGHNHTLNIGAMVLNMAPASVEVKHLGLDFHLDEGLPQMEYLQMDLLGGTMIGGWSITRSGGGFVLNLQGAFSGLDTRRLLPDKEPIGSDPETEISGQVSMAVPLATRSDDILQGMAVNLAITKIGVDALERALYALDPNESNEAIVKQRRQLRIGTPRWVDLEIRYGNLFINGEVEAKGVRVAIPPIEGINIATLPGLEKLEEYLVSLQPVLTLLQAISAGTLAVDPDGKLQFMD